MNRHLFSDTTSILVLIFMLLILWRFSHLNNDNKFSRAQLIFVSFFTKSTATCFCYVQAIIRLHSKLRDSVQHV
jgi:hypothetical protein